MENYLLLTGSGMHPFLQTDPTAPGSVSLSTFLSTFRCHVMYLSFGVVNFYGRTNLTEFTRICIPGQDLCMHDCVYVCAWCSCACSLCVYVNVWLWSLQVPRVWFCLILPLHTGGHNFFRGVRVRACQNGLVCLCLRWQGGNRHWLNRCAVKSSPILELWLPCKLHLRIRYMLHCLGDKYGLSINEDMRSKNMFLYWSIPNRACCIWSFSGILSWVRSSHCHLLLESSGQCFLCWSEHHLRRHCHLHEWRHGGCRSICCLSKLFSKDTRSPCLYYLYHSKSHTGSREKQWKQQLQSYTALFNFWALRWVIFYQSSKVMLMYQM